MIVYGGFSRIQKMLGRTETRTRDRMYCQTIRTVRYISRDYRARIATSKNCDLRFANTDRLKENYSINLLYLATVSLLINCRIFLRSQGDVLYYIATYPDNGWDSTHTRYQQGQHGWNRCKIDCVNRREIKYIGMDRQREHRLLDWLR